MRKLLIVLAVTISLGLIASQVWAGPGCGYWGRSGTGYYSNENPGGSYQDFLNDTANLRNGLAARQGEYNALMAQPNPDPEKAGQLAREIGELEAKLQGKAQAYGVDAQTGPSSGWYCW